MLQVEGRVLYFSAVYPDGLEGLLTDALIICQLRIWQFEAALGGRLGHAC